MSVPVPGEAIDCHVGTVLRRCREDLAVSMAELGRSIGISEIQVQAYEAGRHSIPASILDRAARYLGRHPGDFFPVSWIDGPLFPLAILEIIQLMELMTDAQQQSLIAGAEAMTMGRGPTMAAPRDY